MLAENAGDAQRYLAFFDKWSQRNTHSKFNFNADSTISNEIELHLPNLFIIDFENESRKLIKTFSPADTSIEEELNSSAFSRCKRVRINRVIHECQRKCFSHRL